MKLMIVDDNAAMRGMIREAVTSPGDIVCECASGEEAVSTAPRFRPDCVTMDVRMPGLHGLDAARAILAAQPDVRIVMVTDYEQTGLSRTAAEAGVVACVRKEKLTDLRALLTSGQTSTNRSDAADGVNAATRAALHVLMVEDSPNDCELICVRLMSFGYAPVIERVWREDTMRRALAEREWDIVFIDHSLPGFSGEIALKLMRGLWPRTPVIFITGNSNPAVTRQMLDAGAQKCVSKDDLSALRTVVDALLSEHSVRPAQTKSEERQENPAAPGDGREV